MMFQNTRLLCTIGLSVWSAVSAAGQSAAPAALSGTLRNHVKGERFEVVTSIRGLPLGVRDGLQTLFGGQALDIAEPGAEFQGTGAVVNPKLPIRRLVAAGCSTDHCLVVLRARRERPHVAGGAFSLDACCDPIRVGRYCERRPDHHRPGSERCAVRSGQRPRQGLVAGAGPGFRWSSCDGPLDRSAGSRRRRRARDRSEARSSRPVPT